jgi:hypothetical protein
MPDDDEGATIDTAYGPISRGNIVVNDHLPPPHPPPDQMEIVQTHWGPMQRWRAAAMCIGEIGNVVARAEKARADAGGTGPQVTPLRDEDKPKPLVADEEGTRSPEIDPDLLREIEDACDALDARLSRLEAQRDAERKLLELEAALEETGMVPDEDGQIRLN